MAWLIEVIDGKPQRVSELPDGKGEPPLNDFRNLDADTVKRNGIIEERARNRGDEIPTGYTRIHTGFPF